MPFDDCTIADPSLADWGRKEMNIAEIKEMSAHRVARGIRRSPTAKGRKNCWLPTYDDSDGCSD